MKYDEKIYEEYFSYILYTLIGILMLSGALLYLCDKCVILT